MGDPKKQRKKYSTPSHPWQAERIEEEKVLLKEYGLKNKKEIWKAQSMLRNITKQTKKLITEKTNQARKEETQLLDRLESLGLLSKTANLEDVLSLTTKDILERRLQSIIFKKGLGKTIKQARQFITHRHVTVNDKKVTVPGFLVLKKHQDKIGFAPGSSLFSEEHPERVKREEKPKTSAKPKKALKRKPVRPLKRRKK